MMWKKQECQRRKTEYQSQRIKCLYQRQNAEYEQRVKLGRRRRNLAKNAGQIEMAMGMFALFVVTVVMFVGLKISHFMITGAYVEDALAASNLASALIDVEEYGKTHVLRIGDPQAAFEMYQEALSVNLKLDEEGRSFQQELLEGPVKVLSYIIYNVEGNQVRIFPFTEEGRLQEVSEGVKGQIYTPDGVLVETTTIYSRVEFGVKGIGQQYIQAEKEKSVDIKRDEVENEQNR